MKFKDYLIEFKKEVKGYVFDVDDTLLTTDAKVLVIRGGEEVAKLTPQQFNTYKLGKGESYDFNEFINGEILKTTGKKTPYWKVAQNINDAIKRGDSKSVIYILTARPPALKKDLHKFLVQQGLSELKMQNVYCVGSRSDTLALAQLKKMALKHFKKIHTEVTFFDDDMKNIELAKELKTVKARKV